MHRMILGLTIVISMTALPARSDAQCNRSSRGGMGSASGRFRPVTTTAGSMSPAGAYSPLYTSPTTAYLGNYRSLMAPQQYLRAQQQFMRTAGMQPLPNQSALRSPNEAEDDAEKERSPTEQRRENLRQQNALKAFKTAQDAESKGHRAVAEKNYRKVVRILGTTDLLGRRAADALAELPERTRGSQDREIRLASDSRN